MEGIIKFLARFLLIAALSVRLAYSRDVTPPAEIMTLPGFRVDLIHAVDRKSEGSWVALKVDPQGRVIAADQYGGRFRVTPP